MSYDDDGRTAIQTDEEPLAELNPRCYATAMRKDYEKAFQLRLKGCSYNEINKELGVPKSTLSGWFSDLVLSDEAHQRLKQRAYQGSRQGLLKHNKNQTHEAWQRAMDNQRKGSEQISSLTRSELRVAGAALYWGEGYKRLATQNGQKKTSHSISLANSDPELIQLFIRFLMEILEVPASRIGVQLKIFKTTSPENALQFWQKITKLPLENFEEPRVIESRSSKGRRPYNRLEYGTATVRVNDTGKFHQLIGMIEGLKENVPHNVPG